MSDKDFVKSFFPDAVCMVKLGVLLPDGSNSHEIWKSPTRLSHRQHVLNRDLPASSEEDAWFQAAKSAESIFWAKKV